MIIIITMLNTTFFLTSFEVDIIIAHCLVEIHVNVRTSSLCSALNNRQLIEFVLLEVVTWDSLNLDLKLTLAHVGERESSRSRNDRSRLTR